MSTFAVCFNRICEMDFLPKDPAILVSSVRSSSARLLPTGRKKAKKSKWRVSEAALLGLAVVGGSIGAWLRMKTWHHKTLHRKFRYGVPLILVVQITLFLL